MAFDDPGLSARIVAALEDRARALVAHDPSALRDLLHPDFVYTNASGAVLDVEGYLDLTVRGSLHWIAQVFEVGTLTQAGATVVLTARVEDRVRVDGEDHLWRFATTQVYVEEPERLLYLAGHTGPLAD